MITISLCAIVFNEEALIARWVRGARRDRLFHDVTVVDGGSTDATLAILRPLAARYGIHVAERPFTDFSDQRNFAIAQCRGDWVVELDADELLSAPLYFALPAVCAAAARDGVDCVGLPRINLIDGALVAGPGSRGLDYQYRCHRPHCRWVGRVHEELRDGVQHRVELEVMDDALYPRFILHDKTRARHDMRNAYYRGLA